MSQPPPHLPFGVSPTFTPKASQSDATPNSLDPNAPSGHLRCEIEIPTRAETEHSGTIDLPTHLHSTLHPGKDCTGAPTYRPATQHSCAVGPRLPALHPPGWSAVLARKVSRRGALVNSAAKAASALLRAGAAPDAGTGAGGVPAYPERS